MSRNRQYWLTRWVKRLLNWLSRWFSRDQSTLSAPRPPAAGPAIEQTTTGDRNITVGQVAAGGQVQVAQSKRALGIKGDTKGSMVVVGDRNVINAAPPVPGDPNPFGVPYIRNRYFAGRETVLQQLHQQLTQTGAAAMTQVQAISGLGGIGKTQTAVEYAYRYHLDQPFYHTVFWVTADTEVNLATSFAAIADQLALPGAQALPQADKITAVRAWLNTHPSWLLIFDNADQPDWLTTWMPANANGKVLLTSRASEFAQLGIDEPISLDVLPEAEALTLLFERTGIARSEATVGEAKALNQQLDGLPLALEQASAYIKAQKLSDFELYLRAFGRQGLEQLEKASPKTGNYPSSVLKTWQLNIDAVQDKNPAARALLELTAFLAPDAIPFSILTAGASRLGAELGEFLHSDEANDAHSRTLALRELLQLLNDYSLVQWTALTSTYRVHRLVQAVVRDQLADDVAKGWVEQAITAIATADPGSGFGQWPVCRLFLPHWLTVVEQAKHQQYTSETLGLLCNKAGIFLRGQGRYSEAEPLYIQALEICKTELGERHPSTASSLNNLALLYDSQGRYSEAEPLCIQALEIRKTELGERHPSTANSLNNLASLYKSQGRYSEAEPLYIKVLKIHKTELGEHHPYTATSLNNLALLYDSQGRYSEAELLYIKALEIRKTELGERHPSTANSLNNLASLYESQGRYGEAEPLYIKALEIHKTELGERHPYTATSLNNLASLYKSQGRYSEAEPLYINALEICKTELGERHPSTATSLNNLAGLYKLQSRYSEAEPLYVQALEICKTELGERHPSTASSLNNLALLYDSQDRYSEAEPLYIQALEIYKTELGERHPSTASSLNNLASLYESQRRYSEAEPLYIQALEICKTELGERHPSTASGLNNLAFLYDSQRRYSEAEPLYIQALKICKTELGERHPSTASSLNNLAVLYHQTKRHAKALTHIQQAIEIYTHILGSAHPNTKAALKGLQLIQKALTE